MHASDLISSLIMGLKGKGYSTHETQTVGDYFLVIRSCIKKPKENDHGAKE